MEEWCTGHPHQEGCLTFATAAVQDKELKKKPVDACCLAPLTSGDAVVAHSGAECHATFVFHLLGVSSDKVLWRGPPFVFARQTQDTTKETKMNN